MHFKPFIIAVFSAALAAPAFAAPLELRGLLIPVELANLSSRSPGVIKTIKNEGDAVHAGDIVCQLEDDAERLQVDMEHVLLDKHEFDLKWASELRKKGVNSEDEALTAKANLDTAKIQLKQAEIAAEKKSLHSPIEGIVTKRIRTVGEAVDQYFPVLTVVNPAKLWLETYLAGSQIKAVHIGQPVEITAPESLPGRTFTGKIDFIAPNIDPASGEFRLKILVTGPSDGALRPGMTAVGRLAGAADNGAELGKN